jgi:aryl-alcohol dehydrogenase-like predicted oxidoreductase
VHNAADLLTDNGSLLVETMLRLKEQGVVKKTGVSVYNGQQIDALLKKFTPDLIQLPMNVLDQRLLGSGHLTRLKQLGVEIHVRSAFLQGLLLMEPDSIHPYFEQIRGHLRDYRRFLDEQGLSPIQAALGFVARLEEVDIVLCGVDSLRHFEEIIASPDIGSRADFGRFAINEEAMIDPSQWRLA